DARPVVRTDALEHLRQLLLGGDQALADGLFSVVAPRQARSPGAADSSRSPREEILQVPYGNLRDLVRCSFAWAGVLVRHMPVCCHEGQWYLTDAGLQRLAGELAPMLWRFNANVNSCLDCYRSPRRVDRQYD